MRGWRAAVAAVPHGNGLTVFRSGSWRGRYRPENQVRGTVRGDGVSVGEQLTGVFEYHDAVAKQAPALFGVADEGTSRLVVWVFSTRARGRMRAHPCAS